MLAAFAQTHPQIEVRLVVGNREDTIAALAQLELDIAVMGRPPETIEVEKQAIGDHPHVVIAAPQHPLATRRRLPLDALGKETFLVREPGSGTRSLMERMLAKAGMAPRDYAKFGLAFFQAAMVHSMRSGMMGEVPKQMQARVNMANVEFVAAHQEQIDALIAEFKALSQQ